jgi:hypothetical protein
MPRDWLWFSNSFSLGEEDGRHYGPTLEVDEWNTALLKAGFNGIEADFQDYPDPKDCGLSVIVSAASAPTMPLRRLRLLSCSLMFLAQM